MKEVVLVENKRLIIELNTDNLLTSQEKEDLQKMLEEQQ